MPHTPEWLQDGNMVYTLTADGVNDLWASFYSHTFRRDVAFDAAELAKVAMNERPRLLAQRDELLAALKDAVTVLRAAAISMPVTFRESAMHVSGAWEATIRKAEEADRDA
jgi:hypothetical protein